MSAPRPTFDSELLRLLPQVLAYYGCGVAAAIQVGVMPPLLPMLRLAFSADNAQLGLAASLITAAGAVLAIAAGGWIARQDLRRTTQGGALLLGAGVMATAIAPDFSWLLAGRCVSGLGYLVLVVAAPAAMYRLAGAHRAAMAMALWATFIPVGLAIGSAAAGWLSADWGWRTALAASAAPPLLGAAMLAFCQRLPPGKGSDAGIAGAADWWRAPTLLAMVAAFGLFAGGSQAAILFLPSLLIAVAGWSAPTAATALATGALAGGIVGSIGAGLLLARLIRGPELFALSALALAASVLAIFCALPQAGIALFLASLFLLHGVAGGAGFACLPIWASAQRPMALLQGLLAQTAEICVLSLPPAVGYAADLMGWRAAGLAIALPLLAASALAVFAGSRRVRPRIARDRG